MMELRHLRYFAKLGELEHYGRAAEQLGIAQPGLSRQIHDLETELGTELFEHLPRGVRLSAAGIVFLRECRSLLRDVDLAVARTRNASRGITGRVRLAFVESASWQGVLPDVVGQFQHAYPEVELVLTPMTSPEAHAALETRVDAAFAYFTPPAGSFGRLPIVVNNVMAAIPKKHRLASKRHLELKDFRDVSFVAFNRASAPTFYDLVLQGLGRAGIVPHIIQEGMNEPAVLALVSAGVGVAILNSSMRWRCPANVILKEIRDLDIPLTLDLIWTNDQRSPAVANFVEIVRRRIEA